MELSDKIRIIRKARGLSQEALGDSLSRVSEDGISRQSVSDWENGKSEPKLDNIRDLAQVLNVSFDALLDESIDLNDTAVLTSVLSHTVAERQTEQTVVNKFKYELYVDITSVKSFKNVIVACSLLLITVLLSFLAVYYHWNGAFIYISVGSFVTFLFVLLAIFDLIRIAKGRVRARIGELNNTHLILYAYKELGNTLYIPIEKIEKVELGKEQKKKCGDVLIYVVGRSRPITGRKIIEPKKLLEKFERLVKGEDNL